MKKGIPIVCPYCDGRIAIRKRLRCDVKGWEVMPEKIFQKKCSKCGKHFNFKYIKGEKGEEDRVEVIK